MRALGALGIIMNKQITQNLISLVCLINLQKNSIKNYLLSNLALTVLKYVTIVTRLSVVDISIDDKMCIIISR